MPGEEVVDTALIEQLQELTKQLELDQQAKQEQLLLEQEQQKQLEQEQQTLLEQQQQQQQQQQQENSEFQQSILDSLGGLDDSENLVTMLEQQSVLIDKQNEVIEMFHATLPAVKQFAEWGIIFLGLIPLFMVVRWLGQLFDGAMR